MAADNGSHTEPAENRRAARRAADFLDGTALAITAVLLTFCAWVYYLTTSFEEVAPLFAQGVPPEFLPRLLLWTIALLSVLLPFEHLIKPSGRAHFEKARSKPVAKMAFLTIGLLVLLVMLVEVIGTYFAIVLVCLTLPLLWGERRWGLLIPFAAIFPTLVMLLFAKVLGVYFESGLVGVDFR
ncbi:MAG: tripartite tricarboxylate transporter TctB family protein [Lysobacterales bacterium]|nr:MAG: tripartite tricarboxylate transporter TctB family protein [Xanthomonadales bacterium]